MFDDSCPAVTCAMRDVSKRIDVHGYLHRSPNPWASERSCRRCRVGCRLPLVGSPLCDSGSRSAAKEGEENWIFGGQEEKWGSQRCTDTDFSENYIEQNRSKRSTPWSITSLAYFGSNCRARNKLVLSSRREYLSGLYAWTMGTKRSLYKPSTTRQMQKLRP